MKIEYNRTADALYIHFREVEVDMRPRTSRSLFWTLTEQERSLESRCLMPVRVPRLKSWSTRVSRTYPWDRLE